MSGHRANTDVALGPSGIPDPGPTGDIFVDRSPAIVELESTTGSTETRGLPDPTKSGLILFLVAKAIDGQINVNADTAINQSGHSQMTLGTVADACMLVSVPGTTEGTYRWKFLNIDGTSTL